MSSWVDKVRELGTSFLRAVGAESPPDDKQQVAGPSPVMGMRYMMLNGVTTESPGGCNWALNPDPKLVLKAYGTVLEARAERDRDSGLWNMEVSTNGGISLSDGPEESYISYNVAYNREIKPFKDRLEALGFEKFMGNICFASPMEHISEEPRSPDNDAFEKRDLSDDIKLEIFYTDIELLSYVRRDLSDDEVNLSFAKLRDVLSQDKKLVALSGTRFDFEPEQRPAPVKPEIRSSGLVSRQTF